jgi:hypothetical protein
MNLAEHIDNTSTIESNSFLDAWPVRAEIESHPVGERERVVKPWVVIPEFDDASDGNHQQARLKRLVVL